MSNIVFFQYFCHYCKRTVVTVINAVFFYYLAIWVFSALVCVDVSDSLVPRDPFLERPGNFSGPKSNFEIKTSWILAEFQAHELVNFVR